LARKILLADDSVTAQNMGRKILADAGYEVITVNNGSAALKKIVEQRPDVIVLDVYMPGYSGLEVCQRLKEVGDTARIPILLTVGKLEPFKPEEAKRVRADGFIVKPFEASELLSALTRLEDKIVPRNEPSKPGRFARLAAVEDPRFDKTMGLDEDSGWKNRISFPSKKKKESEDEPGAEPSPIGSLRTRSKSPLEAAPQTKGETVDLGALASAGLPKDVTPEEIAALAAAAARVKGKVAEEKPDEPAEMSVVAPAEGTTAEAPREAEPTVIAVTQVSAEAPDITPETTQAEVPPPAESSEVPSANARLEAKADETQTGAERESPLEAATEAAFEPVTMAVAAMSETNAHASRWTAVSVALTTEDAALSLEQEMQQAYAVFAAAEHGHSSAASLTGSSVSSAEASVGSVPVPAAPAPEEAQSLTAVASAATEAVTAAVTELENVASAYAAQASAGLAESQAPPVAPEQSSTEQSQVIPAAVAPREQAPVAAPEPAQTGGNLDASAHDERPDVPVSPEDITQQTAAADLPATGVAATALESAPQISSELSTQGSLSEADLTSLRDTAAMAATVGGKPVDEAASQFDADPAIASIVDSVLANLRPKIVEEISRKLGRK
jgi:two-component system chemotaxis response regulator CheY